MDKLLELLFKQPLLLFVIGAWLIGMISNALKAKKKAGERARQRRDADAQAPSRREAAARDVASQSEGRRPDLPETARSRPVMDPAPPPTVSSQPTPSQSTTAAQQAGAQNADDVAREMRRILGLEPRPQQAPTQPQGAPAWPEPEAAPVARQPVERQQVERRPVARQPVARQPVARRPVAQAVEPPREGRAPRRSAHVDPHVGEGIRDRHMDRSKFDGRNAGRGFGSLGGRVKKVKARARAGARYSLDDLKTAFVMSEILSPPVSLRPYDSRRP